MITVKKRDGSLACFDAEHIIKAVGKANKEQPPEKQATDSEIEQVVKSVVDRFQESGFCTVEEIQDTVEEALMKLDKYSLAKSYIIYRNSKNLVRNFKDPSSSLYPSILGIVNTNKSENPDNYDVVETDDSISIIHHPDEEDEIRGDGAKVLDLTTKEDDKVQAILDENSNKAGNVASTQRDLIAGEVSKDITKNVLIPEKIREAHENGVLHFHDMDYFIQPIFNCCLINIEDMLVNGTVMNGKEIESPKSFQVACTVTTQIIANIASNQYGGQSIAVKHLARFIRRSEEKIRRKRIEDGLTGETLEKVVKHELADEVRSGVQTIQYQINTLMTTNGQTPFVTLFMQIDEGSEFEKEQAMLIAEILNQRIEGLKNEQGVYVTPPFPKLIYVLDEHNCLKGGKYDWLTKLAVKCSAKRMYPDYISAKIMRENYDGEVFSCMGCRSFLSPWKDENGNYKWEGRFNQGVVSINLPQIAILSQSNQKPDEMKFWQLLEERLSLCFEALMIRHKALLGTVSDISPLHWQFGAIARLKKGEKIDKLLKGGYSTISLGYIGVYETTKLMTGKSHTSEEGHAFAVKLMKYLKSTCERWKEITGIGFGLYGTPAESLCYRFAKIDEKRFGKIKDVTDKGYYTNSYHVDVREEISAFDKLKFESEFQSISSGGAISYVEIPNMSKNLEALEELVKYIYDNIQYAEFNTKSDYCMKCGYDGEIIINDDNEWECPQCHNKDRRMMNVTRRTCGYLGSNFWNVGKTKEIKSRVLHL